MAQGVMSQLRWRQLQLFAPLCKIISLTTEKRLQIALTLASAICKWLKLLLTNFDVTPKSATVKMFMAVSLSCGRQLVGMVRGRSRCYGFGVAMLSFMVGMDLVVN